MSAHSLENLLDRLSSGDPLAVERAFVAYEPYLRMVVRRQLPAELRAKFDSTDIVQSIWVDVILPRDIPGGAYKGGLAVAADGIAPFTVDIDLKVNSFVMSNELSFLPVMNTYLKHGDNLFDAYRACHKHRVE